MEKDIKTLVRDKYAEIVTSKDNSCCSSSCCSEDGKDEISFVEGYDKLEGYVPDADFGLGCGLPTESARLQEGHTVLDLGSGAGNDVFIARKLVGDSGKVIGLDFTPEMITKANQNNEKMGFDNVSFVLGDIEDMPIDSDTIDVVISNCVLNLVPNKNKAYREIHRVLQPGGHIAVSDIVIVGELPEALRNAAAMYVGCVAGALPVESYLDIVKSAGFSEVKVEREKVIDLPDSLLLEHLSPDELSAFRSGNHQILSITVYAKK